MGGVCAMVVYYGWVDLRETCGDELWEYERRAGVLEELRGEMARLEEPGKRELFLREVNGNWVLMISGSRNRRSPGLDDTLDLMRWVARKLPGSFGLLHVRDDEDPRLEYRENFSVWRLARGELVEMVDGLLSPIVPVVEDDVWG